MQQNVNHLTKVLGWNQKFVASQKFEYWTLKPFSVVTINKLFVVYFIVENKTEVHSKYGA